MLKNQKGFTLIEVIVVLVIVGLLASLALTSMFSWIERARPAEIVPIMKNLADQVDMCVISSGISNANTTACIVAVAGGSSNTKHFSYMSRTITATGQAYQISFARNLTDIAPGSYTYCYSCPTIGQTCTNSGTAAGIVSICSYPQDGSNNDANAGKRIIVGAGSYQGMF